MEQIAAIILNYNSSLDCDKCISDLKNQKSPIDIIVVDNNSNQEDLNNLISICREHSVKLIQCQENRGYNAGNNIGLKDAYLRGYKYALISNPDMQYPDKDFIKNLLIKITEDPEIVAIGGNIQGLNREFQNPMKRDGDWRSSFNWIKDILHSFSKSKTPSIEADSFYTESHYCDKLMGSSLIVDLGYLNFIGFFDENVFLYCEEAIFSRTVERDNKKMYYCANTHCIHAHKPSEKGEPVKRYKAWRKSRLYFIDKYSGDNWVGKAIAKLSFSLYMKLLLTIRKSTKM